MMDYSGGNKVNICRVGLQAILALKMVIIPTASVTECSSRWRSKIIGNLLQAVKLDSNSLLLMLLLLLL